MDRKTGSAHFKFCKTSMETAEEFFLCIIYFFLYNLCLIIDATVICCLSYGINDKDRQVPSLLFSNMLPSSDNSASVFCRGKIIRSR